MRLGFIGLGIMGGAMAANLLKAKWEVAVHDVRPEAAEPLLAMGADWADSPAAMAERCDIVFSCLPDFSAIESVALGPEGVLAGARAGATFFEMSTNTLDRVRRLPPSQPRLRSPTLAAIPVRSAAQRAAFSPRLSEIAVMRTATSSRSGSRNSAGLIASFSGAAGSTTMVTG